MKIHILTILRFSFFFIGVLVGFGFYTQRSRYNDLNIKKEIIARSLYYFHLSVQGNLEYLNSPTYYNYQQAWAKIAAQNKNFRSESCIYSLIEANRLNNPEAFYMFARYFHDMTIQTNCYNKSTQLIEYEFLHKGYSAAIMAKDTLYVNLFNKVIKYGWK